MNKKVKIIAAVVLAVLVVIQLMPIDTSAPETDAAQDFLRTQRAANAPAAALLQAACYDCHSHNTAYPWYTRIQPLGWWIKGHIRNGRKKLNFSTWTQYDTDTQIGHLQESIEEIEEKHMPLKSYTWAHPKARLSDAQRQELIEWLEKQSAQLVK